MEVTLKWYEVYQAAHVGIMRQVESMNGEHAYGNNGKNPFQIAIEGACGELAVSLATNRRWTGGVNNFAGEDVDGLQVRTRSEDWHELYIRPADPDGRYVLVTGKVPTYQIIGWYDKRDCADHHEWLHTHGGRDAAWFIPRDRLHPVRDLIVAPPERASV